MPKLLTLRRFGDPILRSVAKQLKPAEIRSAAVQMLIADMRYTNQVKQYGVGLAAPQVGKRLALSLIGIKPTPNRPTLEPFESVIINASYKGIGAPVAMWEACQSCGNGDDILYGQTERFETIRAMWHDEQATAHTQELSGFVAHVFQHEADHQQGILFVDRVKDPHSYMMADEYRKRIIKK
ncbi:MAG TPA: peptide deformylase [Candidatus Saccharimonadales bacterium]|nr:peptide deformylase [Candidatus Saccharimonadales bacterium]